MRRVLSSCLVAVLVLACGSPQEPGEPTPDAGTSVPDAGDVADAGGSPDAGEPLDGGEQPAIASIEVVPDPDLICLPSCTFLSAGQSRLFVARALDLDGKILADVTFTWDTQDHAVATVDETGVVVAHAEGSTAVFARAHGLEGSNVVTVEATRVYSIVVDPTAVELNPGETANLGAEAYDEFGGFVSNAPFFWTSGNPGVATVDAGGLVQGVAQGHAIVRVATPTGGEAWVSVTVRGTATPQTWPVDSITAGGSHVCAIVDGETSCWGWDFFGQLGRNTLGDPQDRFPRAAPVDTAKSFASLALGLYHSCGVTEEGVAYCWGSNASGELGIHEHLQVVGGAVVPMPVLGGHAFSMLAAGGSHSCGLDLQGLALCWGAGIDGQLGNGGEGDQPVPYAVAGGRAYTTIRAGLWSTCALTAAGQAYCWGSDDLGQVGDAGTHVEGRKVTQPVEVAGGHVFRSLDLTSGHACAIDDEGATWCWGRNTTGQLGDGSSENRPAPVLVAGEHAFAQVVVGAHHTCGRTAAGVVWCWGDNSSGQLGNASVLPSSEPVQVAGGLSFTTITASPSTTCGLDSAGGAWCWGSGYLGELGNDYGGESIMSAVPVPVLPPL